MRFLADENFDGRILQAIIENIDGLDVIRAQDTEVYQLPDAQVLAWAAAQNRIVLTHDVNTLINDAYDRVRGNLPMPGVIVVRRLAPLGQLIHDLELMIGASHMGEFVDQVRHIPIR